VLVKLPINKPRLVKALNWDSLDLPSLRPMNRILDEASAFLTTLLYPPIRIGSERPSPVIPRDRFNQPKPTGCEKVL